MGAGIQTWILQEQPLLTTEPFLAPTVGFVGEKALPLLCRLALNPGLSSPLALAFHAPGHLEVQTYTPMSRDA